MGRNEHRSGQEIDGAPPAALCAGSGPALTEPRGERALLAGAIDYAGLFPPASLDMAAAVAEFALQRRAPAQWALGRFVVPLARWEELVSCVRDVGATDLPWPVSVIAGPGDVDDIRERRSPVLGIESVECRVGTPDEAARVARLVPAGVDVFVEPARLEDFDAIAAALSGSGASGKIRTGGITADAFPTPAAVLRFLRTCRRVGLRFKATAGLHHAVRGNYRLTYEPLPPHGEMFGFLNVAVAAALVWLGREDGVVLSALEERSVTAFAFSDDGLAWRGERVSVGQLEEVRARFFVGFGSCSFREPIAELGLERMVSA